VLFVALQLAPQAEARLIDRDPIKNASALLRYALPIDNKPIRQVGGAADAKWLAWTWTEWP